MRWQPVRLNTAIAGLFAVGSSCFVLGSVPAFANAVGGTLDGVTYFVGSIFFTSASFLQLVQAQSPAMTDVDEVRQHVQAPVSLWRWLPRDRNWLAAVTQFPGTVFFNISTLAALVHNATVEAEDRYVWRPDMYGSTLFLVASLFGILGVQGAVSSLPRQIAWVNMTGSILFMVSAIASYVMPESGDVAYVRLSVAGTLLGAVCFLIGALLMIPAWQRSLSTTKETP